MLPVTAGKLLKFEGVDAQHYLYHHDTCETISIKGHRSQKGVDAGPESGKKAPYYYSARLTMDRQGSLK